MGWNRNNIPCLYDTQRGVSVAILPFIEYSSSSGRISDRLYCRSGLYISAPANQVYSYSSITVF